METRSFCSGSDRVIILPSRIHHPYSWSCRSSIYFHLLASGCVCVAAMLRTFDRSGSSQPQTRMDRPRVSHVPTDGFHTSDPVSWAEKRRIYDEWTSQYYCRVHFWIVLNFQGAGKPHNIICSHCRNPGSLTLCETCCRSYHAACAQGMGALSGQGDPFYCPSCKRNQWDQSLQFESLIPSPNLSRSNTPSANGSAVTSPAGSMVDRRPLEAPRLAIYSQTLHYRDSHPDSLSQAKDFLMINGQFPPNQEFPPELLSRLGALMAAAQSQKALQAEIRNLKEENANLRNDNANMRDYFNAKLPTREPMVAAQSSGVSADTSNTATDTSEKAWDRIILDML